MTRHYALGDDKKQEKSPAAKELPRLVAGESERLIDRLGGNLVYGASSLGEFAGMKRADFYTRVYQIVQAIPRGQVATYGQIAWILGKPQCSRRVGQALYHAPHEVNLPCHRVVNSRGRLVPHWAEQKDLLLREEVAFKNNGCVDLKKHLWKIF